MPQAYDGSGKYQALLNLIRHLRDHDPPFEHQGHPQHERGLRMQRVAPPVLRHKMGHNDGDDFVGLAMSINRLDVAQQRLDQQPVGRIEHHQPDAFTPCFPLALHFFGLGGVETHVHNGDIGRERPGVGERGERTPVHAADRHDDPVAPHACRSAKRIQR